MTEQKTMNRWWVVVGALIIQVSLGAVYIWSVFQTPLKSVFAKWTEGHVTLMPQIVLAAFALAVILGGRIQDKLGPRRVATAGGLLLGLGMILARFTGRFDPETEHIKALIWLVGAFSVLGGIGIGVAYVCPIATCVKWFPDKRGLVTGLAVAGFGAGAFFFGPLATGLISGSPYKLLGAHLFGLPKVGVFDTFMTLGFIFLVAVVIGAQLLKNPPAGYRPAGWNPPQPAQGAPAKIDFGPMEMLGTPSFWILWLTYFAGCTGGLMIIMKASPIWQSFALPGMEQPVAEAGFKGVAAAGTMAVSILAIFNALGRILWGKISDILGRRVTLTVMFALCGAAMLLLSQLKGYSLYVMGISLIGMCFGGYLALYPAATADFFGTKHYGVNYGWMFTAYGVGGLLGPWLAAKLMKALDPVSYLAAEAGQTVEKMFKPGDYSTAFVAAGVMCLAAGAVVLTLMKTPKAKPA